MTGRSFAAATALSGVVFLAGCAAAVGADQTERSPSGAIIESGRLGVRHLQTGDCVRDPVPAEVDELVGVPCVRPHRAQVIAVGVDQDACVAAGTAVGVALADRSDLPVIDLSLLPVGDTSAGACLFEFADAVTEDLVRATS